MIKIAFIIDTIATNTAGTQKQLLETIKRLDRSTFEPQLICLWESPWMAENALPCPVTILGYRGFLKANFPAVVRQLAHQFDRDRIDIAQTFFEDSIFVAWLATEFSSHKPVLLSSRRDIGLGAGNQPWYHSVFRRILPLVNRRFAGIIANSEEVRRFVAHREKTSLDKIRVHYNGVDLPDLASASSKPILMADHPEDAWIGLVGSLTPVKRHDLLLRAFSNARKSPEFPGVRLLLLGDGPERTALAALTSQLGISEFVVFAGATPDVGPYLRHLDVGVLCSDREGLSNAILEYMAHGLAVVATAVGGNPELVTKENGILVPPNDERALTDALVTLLADAGLRARYGAASRLKAERQFGWRSSLLAMERDYVQLVAARNMARSSI